MSSVFGLTETTHHFVDAEAAGTVVRPKQKSNQKLLSILQYDGLWISQS